MPGLAGGWVRRGGIWEFCPGTCGAGLRRCPLPAPEPGAQPWACRADRLEAGPVLAGLPAFPGVGCLLPPSPFVLCGRTLLSPPVLRADAQIAVMQQRIDRLALLNEKQAASPLEAGELEELRGKNERYGSPCRPLPPGQGSLPPGQGCALLTAPLPHSLTIRLHETLKQCQDLKTEKGQMDRKINQLSEENGDLSFKVSSGRSGALLQAPWAELVWTVPQSGWRRVLLLPRTGRGP